MKESKEVLRNATAYHTFGITTGNVWRTREPPSLERYRSTSRGNHGNFGESGKAERVISMKAQAHVAFKHWDILDHDCFMFIFNGIVE